MAKQRPTPVAPDEAPAQAATAPVRRTVDSGCARSHRALAARASHRQRQHRPISRRSPSTSAASKRCSGTTIAGRRSLLESVLRQYPEEKELHERVRLYLNICQRQATPTRNRAADDRRTPVRGDARHQRRPATTRRSPICAWCATRTRTTTTRSTCSPSPTPSATSIAEAVAHLERAIALNPENRALARNDPDLEPLRDDDAFRAALESPRARPRSDRRRPFRPRSAR